MKIHTPGQYNGWALLFLVFLAAIQISAQQSAIRFNTLTLKDGLSQSSVLAIEQDKEGFLWFGTEEGLNRYDGYDFKVYVHDPYDSTTISSSFINSLYYDSQNVLWVGTFFGGVCRYNVDKDNFTCYLHADGDSSSLSDNAVRSIGEDAEGNIWLGTNNGLNKLNRVTGSITRYYYSPDNPNGLGSNIINDIMLDDKGRLWIATWGGGVALYDNQTDSFRQYRLDNGLSNYTNKFYQDSKGTIWLTTTNALGYYNPEQDIFLKKHTITFPDITSEDFYIFSLTEGPAGNLWICVWGDGLYRYNPESDSLLVIRKERFNPNSISSNYLYQVFFDKTGSMWLGAMNGGVNVYHPSKSQIHHYPHVTGSNNSLSQENVFAIHEDSKGFVWVGTYEGLNRFDPVTESFNRYYHDAENPNSLSSNSIFAIFQDSKGTLWVGTRNRGLNKITLDDKNKPLTYERYYFDENDSNSLSSGFVRDIFEDRDGDLWIATFGGLNLYQPETNDFKQFLADPGNPIALQSEILYDTFQDVEGYLWVSSSDGLYRYDKRKNIFKLFSHERNNPRSISHNSVFSVSQTHDSLLWIATYGGGLNKYDPKTEKFSVVSSKIGLKNNVVYCAVPDAKQNLWLSTNNGIIKFNYKDTLIIHYGTDDGLQSNEFNFGAYCRGKNGMLYFGGINGFNMFHPDSLKLNRNVPSIVLTDFRVFGQETEISSQINQLLSIELDYDRNVFSFGFAALDYTAPEENQYAYMLEGFHNEWIYSGNTNSAQFTNIDPGEYLFRVKGSNNDGIWNETGKSILLIIHPPFWSAWWFRILVALILIGAAGLMIYSRQRRHTLQKRELERLISERTTELEKTNNELKQEILTRKNVEESLRNTEKQLRQLLADKDKFFSIIAHDLKSPFTSLLGFSEALADEIEELTDNEKKTYAEHIFNSVSRIYTLIINLLEWSRIQTDRVKPQPTFIDLSEMSQKSVMLHIDAAEKKDISIENKIPPGYEVFADRNMVDTVLRNLLSNAVKFTTKGGKIIINAVRQGNTMQISIADSGVGIPPENLDKLFRIDESITTQGTEREPGTGLGLILCKEFVTVNKGAMWVESTPGQGSTFYFTLPVD